LYADLANDLDKAGYSDEEAKKLSSEIKHYEQVRTEIKLASGDYIDLKKYEPAMRTLIDRYVTASESEKLSAFDDLGLVDLIIKKGEDFVEELPDSIKKNRESVAVAATIENNVRRLIVEEMPANPKYFLQMSEILDDLVKRRKQADIEYREYLQRIIELTKHVRHPEESSHYPSTMNNHARRALYDNLDNNEELAISIDEAIRRHAPADFRGNVIRERLVKRLIADIIGNDDVRIKSVFDIIVNQDEYLFVIHKNIKNLHLSLLPPTGSIRVSAPNGTAEDVIRSFVAAKSTWIKNKQQKYKDQSRQTEREYVSGETHYFLGKPYQLKVVSDADNNELSIKGKSSFLLTTKADITVDQKEQIFHEWYRQELRLVLDKLVKKWQPKIEATPTHWRIQKMKTRWGSCNHESGRFI